MSTKNRRGGEGWVDNNILNFLSVLYLIKNVTFLFIFTRICLLIKSKKLHFGQSFLFIKLLYWSESFVTRPETELISQFLLVQISSTKFQSICFTMKIWE